MGAKYNFLRTPRRSCRTCGYEWFLRATVKRTIKGKINGVEVLEPANCPNPRCKSPYWNKPYVLGVKA
jgi:hypothetical protein